MLVGRQLGKRCLSSLRGGCWGLMARGGGLRGRRGDLPQLVPDPRAASAVEEVPSAGGLYPSDQL